MGAAKLTNKINEAITFIQKEDHVVHKGLREAVFESVGPLLDKPSNMFPLRPSSALKPLRDLYYDLCNYEKPGSVPKKDFEPRIKLIFEFGHATETLLKSLCKEAWDVLFEQEKVCYGKLRAKDGSTINLEGSIDWACMLDGELVLFDAKSIGSFPFKTAPKEDNIAQMQLYMHSDWGRRNKVNRTILVYFNKDNSDIKCIEVKYDEQLARRLLLRLKLAYRYWKQGIVPPREYLAGVDWRADYSPYKDVDNAEFTVPQNQRQVVKVDKPYKTYGAIKDAISYHVNNFNNAIAVYLDKEVYVRYDGSKLAIEITPR